MEIGIGSGDGAPSNVSQRQGPSGHHGPQRRLCRCPSTDVLLLPYRGSRIPICQEDAEALFPASVIKAARRRQPGGSPEARPSLYMWTPAPAAAAAAAPPGGTDSSTGPQPVGWVVPMPQRGEAPYLQLQATPHRFALQGVGGVMRQLGVPENGRVAVWSHRFSSTGQAAVVMAKPLASASGPSARHPATSSNAEPSLAAATESEAETDGGHERGGDEEEEEEESAEYAERRQRRRQPRRAAADGGGASRRKRPRAAAAAAQAYTTAGYTAKVVGGYISVTASAVRAVMPGPYGRLFGLQGAKEDVELWGASAGGGSRPLPCAGAVTARLVRRSQKTWLLEGAEEVLRALGGPGGLEAVGLWGVGPNGEMGMVRVMALPVEEQGEQPGEAAGEQKQGGADVEEGWQHQQPQQQDGDEDEVWEVEEEQQEQPQGQQERKRRQGAGGGVGVAVGGPGAAAAAVEAHGTGDGNGGGGQGEREVPVGGATDGQQRGPRLQAGAAGAGLQPAGGAPANGLVAGAAPAAAATPAGRQQPLADGAGPFGAGGSAPGPTCIRARQAPAAAAAAGGPRFAASPSAAVRAAHAASLGADPAATPSAAGMAAGGPPPTGAPAAAAPAPATPAAASGSGAPAAAPEGRARRAAPAAAPEGASDAAPPPSAALGAGLVLSPLEQLVLRQQQQQLALLLRQQQEQLAFMQQQQEQQALPQPQQQATVGRGPVEGAARQAVGQRTRTKTHAGKPPGKAAAAPTGEKLPTRKGTGPSSS